MENIVDPITAIMKFQSFFLFVFLVYLSHLRVSYLNITQR